MLYNNSDQVGGESDNIDIVGKAMIDEVIANEQTRETQKVVADVG